MQQVTPLTGGWSTDTLRVHATCETAGAVREMDLVVRLVPVDGLLAPYDVEREHRILRALKDAPVPVPAVFGCDPAGEYLDGPCLVTEYVPGEPLSFFGQSTDSHDPRLQAYYATLASIHSLDWHAYGLEFLDEADDPIDAELHRVEVRMDLHGPAGPRDLAMLDWLRAHKPPDTTKVLMHGDPNPANYIFAAERIAAVLDWELAFVGDPRTDLGFFAAIQSIFGGAWQLDAASFVRGYADANPSANLRHLAYFEAMGLFRVAAFLHAAKRRPEMDTAPLWQRLHQRFEQIASGPDEGGPAEAETR